jgi:hypothetical protein
MLAKNSVIFFANRTNFKAAITFKFQHTTMIMNDVSLRIESLDGSGELTVRPFVAHAPRHIIAHVSALLVRPFYVSAKQLGKLL